VKSNPKQPSCKKGCGSKKVIVKKDVRSKEEAKKFLIRVNLVPNCGEGNTNSPELSLLPLAYHHSHFLTPTLDFTSFFTMAFLGPHPFLQLGCFGLDYTLLINKGNWFFYAAGH